MTKAKAHWLMIEQIDTTQALVFADALIQWFGSPRNNCLLDGPMIPSGTGWAANGSPTLCFRHLGKADVCFADGHADSIPMDAGTVTSEPGQCRLRRQ